MKSVLAFALSVVCVSCLKEDPEALPPAPPHAYTWMHFDAGDGLSRGVVLDVFYDKPDYWVATSDGLTRYDGNNFYRFTEDDVLVDNYVTSVGRDRNGLLWFGTAGGASLYDPQENAWYAVRQISDIDWGITALQQRDNGDLLIGTESLGIIVYDGEGIFQLFDDVCNDCNQITTIFEDRDENIWVGSVADLKKYDRDFRLERRYDGGLAGRYVLAVYEDPRGRIWVGFNDANAVTRISDGGDHDVALVSALAQVPVYGFATGPADELWIGCFFNGVLQYDGGVTRPVLGGPDEDRFITTMEQVNDQILIGTDDGLYVYTQP